MEAVDPKHASRATRLAYELRIRFGIPPGAMCVRAHSVCGYDMWIVLSRTRPVHVYRLINSF